MISISCDRCGEKLYDYKDKCKDVYSAQIKIEDLDITATAMLCENCYKFLVKEKKIK